MHVETLRLVLIFQRAVQRVGPGDETEIDVGTEPTSAGHFGTGLTRTYCAETCRDNATRSRRHELAREICSDEPACRGIVGAVVGPQRTDLVVVGEGNIGEVLWVEGDLEKVGEAAVRSTAKATG